MYGGTSKKGHFEPIPCREVVYFLEFENVWASCGSTKRGCPFIGGSTVCIIISYYVACAGAQCSKP